MLIDLGGKTMVNVPEFQGKPVIGPADILRNVKSFLECDWEGRVTRHVKIPPNKTLENISQSFFQPMDKGDPGFYGLDENGKVICSVTLYNGYSEADNPVERMPHFHVVATNKTSL